MDSMMGTVKAVVCGVVFVGVVATVDVAASERVEAVDRVGAMAALRAAVPGTGFYETSGRVTRVYGRTVSTGDSPEESADRFLQSYAGVFGVSADDLDPRGPLADERHTHELMFDAETGTYKFTLVYYTHRVGGVRVFRSELRLLTRNEAGFPLVLASSTLRDLGGFVPDPAAALTGAARLARVRDAYPALTRFSDPELVIWAGVDDMNATPRLAYVFVGDNGMVPGGTLAKRLFVVDAVSGVVLLDENQVHEIDVEGTVGAMATEGIGADICEPVAMRAMPYARVELGATQVFTDVDGDFVIPNAGAGEVTVTSRIRGQAFRVTNLGGANSFVSLSVTPPGPANFVHNAFNSTEFDRGEVNAYIHANVVRDFVLRFSPNYPVVANQSEFSVTVNEGGGGLCPGNAQYTGDSLRFCAAGGNSPNTAWSSVVYHEYGHHLVAVAGAGQSQYGEGTGDTMSVLILDDPRLGLGFFGSCDESLRNAESGLQYPCTGAHSCAELLSGSVWDTRNALAVTNPDDYMDILADLAVNAILLHGPSTLITPQIALDYATLDDDDGTLENGSPHYAQIDAGFSMHNLGLPSFLDISFPQGVPFVSDPNEGVEVVVEIAPGIGVLDPESAFILASVNGLPPVAVPLVASDLGENLYVGTLPAAPCFAVIHWYVSAAATSGAVVFSPVGAPAETFAATVITGVEAIATEDFENPVGYEISGSIPSAFNGRWEVGIPAGDGSGGDPPADFDGSGQCYVTGNIPGKDVDGGPTILTSPLLDMSNAGVNYFVGYARWFSNNTGLAPFSDTFEIEISNDDGTTWTNLETVGPDGSDVVGGWIEATHSVNALLEPTDAMRLRFLATDVTPNSTVEAAIDALSIGVGVCDAEDLVAPFIVHDSGATTTPFSGFIDPRAESGDGVTLDLGLETVAIRFSEPVAAIGGGALTSDSFVVTGTGLGQPDVIAVDDSGTPIITLTLSGPIPLGEWTTITALVEDLAGNAIVIAGDQGPGVNESDRVDVAFLPGDVDQSGSVNPLDLLRFKQYVNGASSPDEGTLIDFVDMDRSGALNPLDLLRFKQMINGVTPPSTQAWAGASLNNPRP